MKLWSLGCLNDPGRDRSLTALFPVRSCEKTKTGQFRCQGRTDKKSLALCLGLDEPHYKVGCQHSKAKQHTQLQAVELK